MIKTKVVEEKIKYDGTQLRSLYNYLEHGLLGNSIVCFEGPCDVDFEHMVDGEDLLARDTIAGSHMLHFLVEIFDENLTAGVAIQRLMASLVRDELARRCGDFDFVRKGDDIFWDSKKFSISIATKSPVSVLIHFAVNVSNKGTPVKTCALEDFGIDPGDFAEALLVEFKKEWISLKEATQKVKWVR